jgi:hypothetical protein
MKPALRLLAAMLACLMMNACMTQAGQQPRIDLLGDPAPPQSATRTIAIDNNVLYVNVTGGEIIQFVVNGKAFAWNFDSAQPVAPFDLRLIAPPDIALDHQVVVYVARNPLYVRHHGPFWSPWPP